MDRGPALRRRQSSSEAVKFLLAQSAILVPAPSPMPPPTCRAVFKLAQSRRPEKRAALLAFLEQTAEHGEPAALEMRESRGAEVYALVAALRDAREGRPTAAAPPDEALSNLVRAVAALATCGMNRRYLLEAGCLDALAEALASPQPELATLAVQVGMALWACV